MLLLQTQLVALAVTVGLGGSFQNPEESVFLYWTR